MPGAGKKTKQEETYSSIEKINKEENVYLTMVKPATGWCTKRQTRLCCVWRAASTLWKRIKRIALMLEQKKKKAEPGDKEHKLSKCHTRVRKVIQMKSVPKMTIVVVKAVRSLKTAHVKNITAVPFRNAHEVAKTELHP